MKATSIQNPISGADWARQVLEPHADAPIVKVLLNPEDFGVTRYLIINAIGFVLLGRAAKHQQQEGIVNILNSCENLYEAAGHMWERRYGTFASSNARPKQHKASETHNGNKTAKIDCRFAEVMKLSSCQQSCGNITVTMRRRNDHLSTTKQHRFDRTIA